MVQCVYKDNSRALNNEKNRTRPSAELACGDDIYS